MEKFKNYFISIVIPVGVGAIVGLIISPYMDYMRLKQPPLAPPGILFPTIWTILYILMGISYGVLRDKELLNEEINKIYYLQLAVNALWSIFFFVFKWRLFSFLWIILLAVLIILMISKFYRKNKIAGFLQIPYLLWVFFATYLNLSIYLLNR